MKVLMSLVVGLAILGVSQVGADPIEITPFSGELDISRWEGLDGQLAPGVILNYIATTLDLSLGEELYKKDYEGEESGDLAGSYGTIFSGDPNDATISYLGDGFVGPIAYLLVKNGNHTPPWYLFDLTALNWSGTEVLQLSGFWASGGGAISHVALYGTRGNGENGDAFPGEEIPEPGTLLLLGTGLVGVMVSRRRQS